MSSLVPLVPWLLVGANTLVFVYSFSMAIAVGLHYGRPYEQPWEGYNHSAARQRASDLFEDYHPSLDATPLYHHYDHDPRSHLLMFYCGLAVASAVASAVYWRARQIYDFSPITMGYVASLLLLLGLIIGETGLMEYLTGVILVWALVACVVYRRVVSPTTTDCCNVVPVLCPATFFAVLRLSLASMLLLGILPSGMCSYIECASYGMFQVYIFTGTLGVLVLILAIEDLLTCLVGDRHVPWAQASSIASSLLSILAHTLVSATGARPFTYRNLSSHVQLSAESVSCITLFQCWLQWWAPHLYFRSLFHGVALPCCRGALRGAVRRGPPGSAALGDGEGTGTGRGTNGTQNSDDSNGLDAVTVEAGVDNNNGNDGVWSSEAARNGAAAPAAAAATAATAADTAASAPSAVQRQKDSTILCVNIAVIGAGLACLSPYADYSQHSQGRLQWYEVLMTVMASVCVVRAAGRLMASILMGDAATHEEQDAQRFLHTLPPASMLVVSSALCLAHAPHGEAFYGALLGVFAGLVKFLELSETTFVQRLYALFRRS